MSELSPTNEIGLKNVSPTNEIGLNRFDIVFYINLDIRTDRRQQIESELSKTNIDKDKIHRIEAVYTPELGYIGCTMSHILAYEKFLETPDHIQNCIIFEDDFEFVRDQTVINTMIDQFFEFDKGNEYDVLMFACGSNYDQDTSCPSVKKITNAQTMSGYCLNKKFAKTLLENYRTSLNLLQTIKPFNSSYCNDMYMKSLQHTHNWYRMEPKLGKQRESYSDILKKKVNYMC